MSVDTARDFLTHVGKRMEFVRVVRGLEAGNFRGVNVSR